MPATQKRPRPAASKTSTVRIRRSTAGWKRNVTNAAAIGAAKYGHSVNAAGGMSPMSTSRSTPPPIAVRSASTTIPTTSKSRRTARNAPEIANANTPMISRTSTA